MQEVLQDIQQQVLEERLEEQLAAMRVPMNVPLDHNLFQLFLEALNPGINANELNDDDLAAYQEQLNEMVLNGDVPLGREEEEEQWEEDWDSDLRVC